MHPLSPSCNWRAQLDNLFKKLLPGVRATSLAMIPLASTIPSISSQFLPSLNATELHSYRQTCLTTLALLHESYRAEVLGVSKLVGELKTLAADAEDLESVLEEQMQPLTEAYEADVAKVVRTIADIEERLHWVESKEGDIKVELVWENWELERLGMN